jgi:molybdopterin converting factor small subunit
MIGSSAPITVEFFGIPRHRAGCAEGVVHGGTLADVLAAIESAYPGLHGLRRADGGLAPHYLLSLDGDRFLSDPQQRLEPGCRLLLLSADAGG